MSGHLGPEKWGIAKFFFRITLDGTQLSFQEVNGMNSTTKVIEYRHGDSEDFFPTKRLGLSEFGEITLKKGVFADDLAVTEFYNAIYDKEYMSETTGRFDALFELLDETGDTILSWNLHNCIPVKLTLDGLKSDDNAAAVESIEVAVENILTQF